MTYMEKQKAEMETIKPRAFFVDLSDADVQRPAIFCLQRFLNILSVTLYSGPVQTVPMKECTPINGSTGQRLDIP